MTARKKAAKRRAPRGRLVSYPVSAWRELNAGVVVDNDPYGRSPAKQIMDDVMRLVITTQHLAEMQVCGFWPIPAGRTFYRLELAAGERRTCRWAMLPDPEAKR